MALGWAYPFPPLPSRSALVARPWLRFHTPLIEPDVRICRVAQPVLAFAPTDPTMRRYRSGLFRKDPRRGDHRCHAWWIAGFWEGEGNQELAVDNPVHAALLAAFAERLAPVPDNAFLEHAQ